MPSLLGYQVEAFVGGDSWRGSVRDPIKPKPRPAWLKSHQYWRVSPSFLYESEKPPPPLLLYSPGTRNKIHPNAADGDRHAALYKF